MHSGCSCQTGRLFPRLRSPATFSVILCHYYSIHVCIVKNSRSLLDEIVTCCICFNVSLVYSAVQCLTMAITNGNLLYNFDIALSTSFYAVCQRISVYFSNRIWTCLILRQKLIKIRRLLLKRGGLSMYLLTLFVFNGQFYHCLWVNHWTTILLLLLWKVKLVPDIDNPQSWTTHSYCECHSSQLSCNSLLQMPPFLFELILQSFIMFISLLKMFYCVVMSCLFYITFLLTHQTAGLLC